MSPTPQQIAERLEILRRKLEDEGLYTRANTVTLAIELIEQQEASMTPAEWTAWRKHLGITNAEAARRLGISKNMPAAYERGTRAIPIYVALACAALAYGLPPWRKAT